MEKLEKGELVTLDNKKEYLVYDTINKNNKRYIYLSYNTENIKEAEVLICEEKQQGEDIVLELLTDKEEIKDVANELLKGIEE